MILEAFVLSIIIGFIRKGKLQGLSNIPIKRWFLFILPFILSALVVAGGQIGDPESRLVYIRMANVLQYILLLAAIIVNIHIKEMWLVGIGTFFNALVVAVNGGMMPVSITALKLAGMDYLLKPGEFDWGIRHAIMTASTKLSFLGDIIPRPGIGKVMPEVASIGDLLLAVGVFLLIQRYMCRSAQPAKETEAVE